MLDTGQVAAGTAPAGRHSLFIELVPATGYAKEHFRVDSATLSGRFDSEAGAFQHLTALLFALEDSALDLVRVEGVSVWERRKSKFGGGTFHIGFVTP